MGENGLKRDAEKARRVTVSSQIDERSLRSRIQQLAADWTPGKRYSGQIFLVQDVVRAAYPDADVQVVCSDQFMDKTTGVDRPEWVARELIQNCIDHNPHAPQTLENVSVHSEQLEDGYTRFIISGQWNIPDTSGLVSPHSEGKAEHSAGGNGIGLKQTALLLEKQFGARRFEVVSAAGTEATRVRYLTAKKEDLQAVSEGAKSRTQTQLPDVKNNWLVAVAEDQTMQQGVDPQFLYIIETNEPDTVRALGEVMDLGVHEQNPFLQNMDIQNEKGGLKWLPLDSTTADSRLFINGQVMNVEVGREEDGEYWQGLQHATLNLRDVDYAITMMRPPVGRYEIGSHIEGFVRSFSIPETIEQLKHSEYLWTTYITDERYTHDRVGAMMIVEALIANLRVTQYSSEPYTYEQFQVDFDGKSFRAVDRPMDAEELQELQEKGFVLCPSFFSDIGVPGASAELESTKKRVMDSPDASKAKRMMERMMKESGIEVGYTPIEKEMTFPQYIQECQRALSEFGSGGFTITTQGECIFSFTDKKEDPSFTDVATSPLFAARSQKEKAMSVVRGLIVYGTEKGWIESGVRVTNHDTTISIAPDTEEKRRLFMKKQLVKGVVPKELRFYISKKGASDFQAVTKAGMQEVSGEARAVRAGSGLNRSGVREVEPKEKKPFLQSPEGILATAGAFVVSIGLAAGGIYASRNSEGFSGSSNASEQVGGELIESGHDDEHLENADVDEVIRKIQSLGFSQKTGSATREYLRHLDGGGRGFLQSAVEKQAQYAEQQKLKQLLGKYDTHAVPASENRSPQSELIRRIEASLPNPDGDVEHFAIVEEPSEYEISQLALLRSFLEVATGYHVTNDLFLFTGEGAAGINLQKKAIGLHRSLLDEGWDTALSVTMHEVAHNVGRGHEPSWQNAYGSLMASVLDALDDVAGRVTRGEQLTELETALVYFDDQWEALQDARKQNAE